MQFTAVRASGFYGVPQAPSVVKLLVSNMLTCIIYKKNILVLINCNDDYYFLIIVAATRPTATIVIKLRQKNFLSFFLKHAGTAVFLFA
jgi:hypothetical protein